MNGRSRLSIWPENASATRSTIRTPTKSMRSMGSPSAMRRPPPTQETVNAAKQLAGGPSRRSLSSEFPQIKEISSPSMESAHRGSFAVAEAAAAAMNAQKSVTALESEIRSLTTAVRYQRFARLRSGSRRGVNTR